MTAEWSLAPPRQSPVVRFRVEATFPSSLPTRLSATLPHSLWNVSGAHPVWDRLMVCTNRSHDRLLPKLRPHPTPACRPGFWAEPECAFPSSESADGILA